MRKAGVAFSPGRVGHFLVFLQVLRPKSGLSTLEHLKRCCRRPRFRRRRVLHAVSVLTRRFSKCVRCLFSGDYGIMGHGASMYCCSYAGCCFRVRSPSSSCISRIAKRSVGNFHGCNMYGRRRPTPLIRVKLFVSSSNVPLSVYLASNSSGRRAATVPTRGGLTSVLGKGQFVCYTSTKLNSCSVHGFGSVKKESFVVARSVGGVSRPLRRTMLGSCSFGLLSSSAPMAVRRVGDFGGGSPRGGGLCLSGTCGVIATSGTVSLNLCRRGIFGGKGAEVMGSGNVLGRGVVVAFSEGSVRCRQFVHGHRVRQTEGLLIGLSPRACGGNPGSIAHFVGHASIKGSDRGTASLCRVGRTLVTRRRGCSNFCTVTAGLASSTTRVVQVDSKQCGVRRYFQVLGASFSDHPMFRCAGREVVTRFVVYCATLLVCQLLRGGLSSLNIRFAMGGVGSALLGVGIIGLRSVYCVSACAYSRIYATLDTTFSLELSGGCCRPGRLGGGVGGVA